MPKPPKDLTYSIAKLALEPGDVLVVRAKDPPNQAATAMINRLVPGGVRVLFIPPDVDLSVLTKADIEARIETGDLISWRIAKGLKARAAMLFDWRKLYGTPPQ